MFQRAVVSMSRETEQNISRILRDVRRDSDTSQTGLASLDSWSGTSETMISSSSGISYDDESTSQSTASLTQTYDDPDTSEDTRFGIETVPEFASGACLTGLTGSAGVSTMEVGSGSGASGSGSQPLFFIDCEGEGRGSVEGEGRGSVEGEVRQSVEELTKLNDTLKSEFEEKEKSNSQYKKMMVCSRFDVKCFFLGGGEMNYYECIVIK